MSETKRARLVERRRNSYHGGPCEIWDVGDGHGILVDFCEDPFDTGEPETMAFPLDMPSRIVTSWDPLGTWYEDATGGKAIRELGYSVDHISAVELADRIRKLAEKKEDER